MRTAGVDRIPIASRSVRVSPLARDESPTTTVARSGPGPLTSSTGPRRLSQVVADDEPDGPIVAGRSGTDESIAGAFRRCSQPLVASATKNAITAHRRLTSARVLERCADSWAGDMSVRRK